jgi:hypothetical protein
MSRACAVMLGLLPIGLMPGLASYAIPLSINVGHNISFLIT